MPWLHLAFRAHHAKQPQPAVFGTVGITTVSLTANSVRITWHTEEIYGILPQGTERLRYRNGDIAVYQLEFTARRIFDIHRLS